MSRVLLRSSVFQVSVGRGIPVVVAFILLLPTGQLWAQAESKPASTSADAAEVPELTPVLIANFASMERCLTDLSQMFAVSGRADMMGVIEGFLGEKAGDLQGLDRTRSFGLMVFLEKTLPPRPRMILYLPVSSEPELITTLRLGPAPITEIGEHEYEVENRGRRGKTPLLVRDGYAFLLPTGDEFLEGQEIPRPETVTRQLSERYDVSLSFVLRGVPPLIREVFSTFITQQFSAQMQQRDTEPDAAYEARKTRGLSSMKWLEQLLRDGEEVTLGLDSTEDGKRAVLELTIEARPESEFARYLTGIAGKPSSFASLSNARLPLQINVSWNMDAREEEAAIGYLNALRIGLKKQLPEESATDVDRFVDILNATAAERHVDAVIQFVPQTAGELVLLGGLKVVGAEALGTALRQVVSDLGENDPNVEIHLDQHQYQGVSLHQLHGNQTSGRRSRIFGEEADLYVGSGPQVLWLGFGGKGTLPTLDAAIDALQTPAPDGPTSNAPFQASLHAGSWLKFSSEKERNSDRGLLAQDALGNGNDTLLLEIRPTESGGRVSLRFDEGFVRFVGLLLAQLYDRTQL